MARGHQATVTIASHFVPPDIAIRRRNDLDRQLGATDLDIRITVTGQCEGAPEIAVLDETEIERLVLSSSKQCSHRIAQQPQYHRSRGYTNADVVFDHMPLVVAADGGDLDRPVIVDVAEPGQQRVQQ